MDLSSTPYRSIIKWSWLHRFLEHKFDMETPYGYQKAVCQCIIAALFNRNWLTNLYHFVIFLYGIASIVSLVIVSQEINENDIDIIFIRDIVWILASLFGIILGIIATATFIDYQIRKLDDINYHRPVHIKKLIQTLNFSIGIVFTLALGATVIMSIIIIMEEDYFDEDIFALAYSGFMFIIATFYITFWVIFIGGIGAVIIPTILYITDTCCLPCCSWMETMNCCCQTPPTSYDLETGRQQTCVPMRVINTLNDSHETEDVFYEIDLGNDSFDEQVNDVLSTIDKMVIEEAKLAEGSDPVQTDESFGNSEKETSFDVIPGSPITKIITS